MGTIVIESKKEIQKEALFDFFAGIIPFYDNNWKNQSIQKMIGNTNAVEQPTQALQNVTQTGTKVIEPEQKEALFEFFENKNRKNNTKLHAAVQPTQALVNADQPTQETIETILKDINDDFNGEIQISNELEGLIEGLQGITKHQQKGGNCSDLSFSLTKISNQNYYNKNVILLCEGFGAKENPISCEAEIVHMCDNSQEKKHTFVYDGINYDSGGIISDFVNFRCDMKYLRWFEENNPKENPPQIYRGDRITAIVNKIKQYSTASNIYLIGISHGSLLMQRALIQLSQDADNNNNNNKELLNKIHLITISSPRYPKGGIINKIWLDNKTIRVYNYYCVHDGMYNSKFVKFMMGKYRRLPLQIDALSNFKVSPIDNDNDNILTSYKVIVQEWLFNGVQKGDPLYHCYPGLMFLGDQETPFGNEFIHTNGDLIEHCAPLLGMMHYIYAGLCATSTGGSNSSKKVSRYVKSDERVILGGRSRVIWLGKRGCRYIKRDGEYVKLSIASKSSK